MNELDNLQMPDGYEEEMAAIQVKRSMNIEARLYLANTDWYVIRKNETGKEIPDDVLVKRADAREAIT
jgi:hypothetical protein